MRPFAALVLVSACASFSALACSANVSGNSEDGTSATVTDCKTVHSTPTRTQKKNDSGDVESTTMSIEAAGCIADQAGGAAVVNGLVSIINDNAKLAAISGEKGKIFSKWNAHAPTGQIDGPSGQSRTIDVTFNADHSPSTTLKVTLKKSANGELSFALTNTKGIGVLFFTAVDAGGLDVRLTAKPNDGGVTIGGTTKIVANAGYEDNLKDLNDLPSLVIHWLQDEIAKR